MPDDSRRSTRLSLQIPVELSYTDAEGNKRLERTVTQSVDRHGAKVRTQCLHRLGSQIHLGIPHLGRGALCSVVWCSQVPHPVHGQYEVGLAMHSEVNPWQVSHAPEDWQREEEAPAPIHARPEVEEVLRALVGLLEEKGIVTRQEILERLRGKAEP